MRVSCSWELELQRVLLLLAGLGLLVGLALPLQAQEFLPPEEAFRVDVSVQDPACTTDCLVNVVIDVEPEYYLYRERFQLQHGEGVGSADWAGLPNGKRKFDENLGLEIEALRGQLQFGIRYNLTGAESKPVLNLVSQGCADAGLCYPPMTTPIALTEASGLGRVFGGFGVKDFFGSSSTGGPQTNQAKDSTLPIDNQQISKANQVRQGADESGSLASRLESQPIYIVLPVFFGLGLLLAFTPCTLPMLPIVTSLVVGQGGAQASGGRFRSFALALVYVLGMAFTYALLGILAGLSGQSLVIALQQPPVLWSFGGLLAILGVALLLGYQIQLPASFQGWLQEKTGKLQGGQYVPVLVMGVLSALLLGPCVAPPLAGALLYIGQTGNAVVGGLALFLLALGMGLPMVLLAAGAGTVLPKAGNWMKVVSGAFGFILLGVALWIIQPVTSSSVMFMLWSVWLVLVAASFRVVVQSDWIKSMTAQTCFHALGLLAQLVALVYLVGFFTGAASLINPLEKLQGGGGQVAVSVSAHEQFQKVESRNVAQVISESNVPVMLDFYADWCVSCKEFELFTLPDPKVQALLQGIKMIQVDVTENNVDDQALLKTYGLFGPPAILFFQAGGFEVSAQRVIGFQSAQKFANTLVSVREALELKKLD